jgi:large subunit ribosomal protein L18
MQSKDIRRIKRQKRIRGRIAGTASKPRLRVHRTNKFIYAQLIDDEKSLTLGGVSDIKQTKGNGIERATIVGAEISKIAKAQKITTVVFDRAGYKYHGRVKALADSAREAGLIF